MNKGMLTIGIILLSLIALLLINVLTNFSSGSELDYYLVRETADAALVNSLDKIYERDCGVPRLDRERFVENFLYRFIKNIDTSREYDLYFYDINEVPPKASVKVDSLTVLAFNVKDKGGQQASISTSYDVIGVTNYQYNFVAESNFNNRDSNACKKHYGDVE